MESQRFDNFSRKMASGASRRTVLRGLAGGALAAVGLRAGVAAQADKVAICHYDADTGTYQRINVSQNAYDAHIAHGDDSDIGCAEGYTLDLDTCACVRVNACADLDLEDRCGAGDGGICLQSVATGELVCVGIGACANLGCDSDDDCQDSGSVCVYDDSSVCGANHCHPLA